MPEELLPAAFSADDSNPAPRTNPADPIKLCDEKVINP
jgi:hypothetical protein